MRKVYYNITVTALSVFVALVIGGIEIISIITDRFGITEGPIAWIGGLDLNRVGFVIVGVFILSWIIALLVWKFGNIEQKWEAGMMAVNPDFEAELQRGMELTLDEDLSTDRPVVDPVSA